MAVTFSSAVERWALKAQGNFQKVAQDTIEEIGTNVILMNPVDTGRAVTGWRSNVGAPIVGERIPPDPTRAAALQELRSAVRAIPKDQDWTFFFINGVPYILRLEFGWSRQAPRGMLGINTVNFQNVARRKAAAVS